MNINPAYRVHELQHALNLVGCKGLVVTSTFKKSNYGELLNNLIPELASHTDAEKKELAIEAVPSLKFVFCLDRLGEVIPGTIDSANLVLN